MSLWISTYFWGQRFADHTDKDDGGGRDQRGNDLHLDDDDDTDRNEANDNDGGGSSGGRRRDAHAWRFWKESAPTLELVRLRASFVVRMVGRPSA